MEKLKPAEILKAVHTCGASFCTTDHHECPYGDDGCIDCVDRLEADFEALIAAGDDLVIRRAAPANEALTLKQLREMKGQPVYCIGQTRFDVHFDGWKVVAKNNLTANVIRFTDGMDFPVEVYGERLLAYARKPEGSKP